LVVPEELIIPLIGLSLPVVLTGVKYFFHAIVFMLPETGLRLMP